MNIIEAIRSGRRFRRRTETCWYRLNVDTQEFLVDVEGTSGVASINITNPESFDSIFLCDDWEIEEEKIEITATELSKAITATYPGQYTPPGFDLELWNKLKEMK